MTVIYEYGAFPQDADGHEHFFTLSELTDEQLDEGRLAFINEKERRERIATIPDQMSQLASVFISGGGDPVKIEEAVLNVTQVSAPELKRSWPETLPGTPIEAQEVANE